MNAKRIFAIFMALVILFSVYGGHVSATEIEDTIIEDIGQSVTEEYLEELAVAYVEKYIQTSYQYETVDFIENTLIARSMCWIQ